MIESAGFSVRAMTEEDVPAVRQILSLVLLFSNLQHAAFWLQLT